MELFMLKANKKERAITMMEESLRLRRELEGLLNRVDAVKRSIANIEQSCKHDWTDAEYTPEQYRGYHDLGDPVGTMGIDRQLPFDVPPRTVDKWTRSCKKCGTSETTTRTKESVKYTPVF